MRVPARDVLVSAAGQLQPKAEKAATGHAGRYLTEPNRTQSRNTFTFLVLSRL